MKPTITAVVITKNEEKMIVNCLACLSWCEQIIVVDSGSDDHTVELAEQQNAQIIRASTSSSQSLSFADLRNSVLPKLKTDWVVYIDTDERVSPTLSQEILVNIETSPANALAIHRENMMYGQVFTHGGWDEWVTRVFRVSTFEKWIGDIHESPTFTGDIARLHTSLLHLTHRNTVDGLNKTISWTPIEAKLLAEANVPPVTVWTLLRKGTMEFLRRAFFKKGYQDGQAGLIEAVVQGINRILVYIQVWELQQHPSLTAKYEEQELAISSAWKKKT